MRRLHAHLRVLAVAALLFQAAAAVLGPLRVCWSDGHTHGGAAECPMHDRSEQQPAHHAHHAHDHGSLATGAASGAQQVTCRCSDDPAAPYVGPAALLTAAVAVPRSTETMSMRIAGQPWPAQVWPSLLSPPPRSTLSTLV